jgi:hypothetical protein
VRGRGRSEAGQARAARFNNRLGGTCLTAVSAANEGSLPPLTRAVSTEGSRLARADPSTMSTAAGRVNFAWASKNPDFRSGRFADLLDPLPQTAFLTLPTCRE